MDELRDIEVPTDMLKPPRETSSRAKRADERRLSGRSAAMRALLARIEKVAPTGASVMIAGESGVGKDIVARRLHELSPRRNGPFVAVNCGAIPADIAESQLFGHEKGSFTGAKKAASPARPRSTPASSKPRAAARCCSTKSRKCRPRCR